MPKIHHGLSPLQTSVEEFDVKSKDGRRVALVDTPGFSSTKQSDHEILSDIIKFLESRPVFDVQLALHLPANTMI